MSGCHSCAGTPVVTPCPPTEDCPGKLPLFELYSPTKVPYKEGSIVWDECGYYMLPCGPEYAPPRADKSKWIPFDPKQLVKLMSAIVGGPCSFMFPSTSSSDVGDTCMPGFKRVWGLGEVRCHDGKLYCSKQADNATDPNADGSESTTWSQGLTSSQLICKLLALKPPVLPVVVSTDESVEVTATIDPATGGLVYNLSVNYPPIPIVVSPDDSVDVDVDFDPETGAVIYKLSACGVAKEPTFTAICVASGGAGTPYDGIQVDTSLTAGTPKIQYLTSGNVTYPLKDATWVDASATITNAELIRDGGFIRVGVNIPCGWQWAVQKISGCCECCRTNEQIAQNGVYVEACFTIPAGTTRYDYYIEGTNHVQSVPANEESPSIEFTNTSNCPVLITVISNQWTAIYSDIPDDVKIAILHYLADTSVLPLSNPIGYYPSHTNLVSFKQEELVNSSYRFFDRTPDNIHYPRMSITTLELTEKVMPGQTIKIVAAWIYAITTNTPIAINGFVGADLSIKIQATV